jgi:hypothetical protein
MAEVIIFRVSLWNPRMPPPAAQLLVPFDLHNPILHSFRLRVNTFAVPVPVAVQARDDDDAIMYL